MKLAKRNEMSVRASWPLMALHRVLTGDRQQFASWKDRIDKILQSTRLSRTRSPMMRKVIAHSPAWKRARGFGRLGSFVVLAVAGSVTMYLALVYSQLLHFGAWPWLLFVPPLVPAAMVAKRSLEDGALAAMASTGGESDLARSRSAAFHGFLRSFVAGFKGGFALLFLQGLMSWFMTPAATIAQELILDTVLALQAGVVMGALTAPLGLFLGFKPVNPRALPAAPQPAGLLMD